MRDFIAGRDINVEGNVHIVDNSEQSKSYAAWTYEELLVEENRREGLRTWGRKAKWKRLATTSLILEVILGLASLWFYLQGNKDFSSLILGLGGLAIGSASINVLDKPNDFEASQIAELKLIRVILQERDAERDYA